ncbi:MAG: SMP-30/gluconolactonase/LRE family protein [Planctomycetes bacterium]|nr:SMP-30/gluconolactonase/LRE family protein [Planctomycetota bacterium]
MYRIVLFLGLAAVLTLLPAKAADEGGKPLTDADVRLALGPASALIRVVKTAPAIDGRPYDEAWKDAPAARLRYADPDIVGPAKFGGDVRVVADAEHLYVCFNGRTKGDPKGEKRAADDPKILEDNFFAFCLLDPASKAQPPTKGVLVAVNPEGSLYHAEWKDGAWSAAWNPSSVEAQSNAQYGWWSVELKIGLKDLAVATEGKPVWFANFLRRNSTGAAPKADDRDDRNSVCAWAPSFDWLALKPNAALGALVDPQAKDFAKVTAPFRLREPIVTPPDTLAFEFSEAELENIYPGRKVRLVPTVEKAPVVDGDASDEAWLRMPLETLGFLDAELEGRPEKNATLISVVSDKENLYALFQCEETQVEKIVADDRAIWTNDVVDLLLDVGRSFDYGGGNYYGMEVNSKARASLYNGNGFEWRPKSFKTAAKIGKGLWTVEMKVSFADLGIEPKNFPKVFGANFTRSRAIDRSDAEGDPTVANTDFAWAPNLLDTPHVLDTFGVLYLQAGNALPDELLENLKAKGKDSAALGLKVYEWPKQKVENVPALPPRTAKFKQAPKVEVKDGKATVTFEVAEPVDAAVSIVDEKGATVRHLAAGQLGDKAPPPLKAASNAQAIGWDFTDDYGKPVPAGAYKARVGLGVQANFERVLIGDPHRMSNVMGLAVDATGVVYVLMEDAGPAHYRIANIMAYSREGKFQRHVLPFPARLPKEKVYGANVIANPEGGYLPIVYQALLHSYIPQFGSLRMQRPVVTKDGHLLVTNTVDEIRMRVPKRIFKLGTDGSVERDYLGPLLGAEAFRGKAAMALSPDERWLYVTGLAGKAMWVADPPHHAVYRFDLKGENPPLADGYAPVWLGERFVPGADEAHFSDPNGIAVDAKGNIYVADTGNDRIAVFTPEGKFVRALKVKAPDQVEVHPKTGALYVFSLGGREHRIVKLDADGKEQASLAFPKDKRATTILALDPTAEPPVLWFIAERRAVHKVIDQGGKLVDQGDVIHAQGDTANDLNRRNNLQNFELVQDGKQIYIYGLRYDAETGKFLPGDKTEPLVRGNDGRLYHFVPKWEIRRFTADGKPDPFPKGVKGSEPGLEGVLPAKACYYFTVDKQGNVYTMSDQLDKTFGTAVHKYRNDGSLERTDFIQLPLPAKSSGPVATLDCGPDGNFYLACNIKEPGNTVPKLFEGRLPAYHGDAFAEGAVYPTPRMFYEHFYGTIAKFGPDGGKIVFDDDGQWLVGSNYGGIRRAKIDGIQWAHLGLSPLVYRNRDHARCTCEHASFGMDGYGRMFLPDAFRCHVEVIDTNANVLTRFGRYGNQDARGPGSPEGEPEIGFACPVRVRVHENACYVADRIDHRILKLKLSYLAQEEAAFAKP